MIQRASEQNRKKPASVGFALQENINSDPRQLTTAHRIVTVLAELAANIPVVRHSEDYGAD